LLSVVIGPGLAWPHFGNSRGSGLRTVTIGAGRVACAGAVLMRAGPTVVAGPARICGRVL